MTTSVSLAQPQSAYNLAAELNAAAADGDIAVAKRVLDSGLDINYKRSDQTALHFAIFFKRPEIVKFLLERRADLSITDGNGLNALELAQKSGNSEIIQIIKRAIDSGKPAADGKIANSDAQPSVRSQNGSLVSSEPITPTSATRDKFGRFKVGDHILHSRDRGKTWERGTVLKVNTELQKYLIENEAKTVQNYYDSVYVTTVERQPYWTSFFIGDGDLTLPMTMTTRVHNNDVYAVFAGGVRLPPLRINADGTYSWATGKNSLIRGRWQVSKNGPSLILLNGDRGNNWILYNTSDAIERENFKTDTVRLVSEFGNYTLKHGFRIQKK